MIDMFCKTESGKIGPSDILAVKDSCTRDGKVVKLEERI